MGAGILKAVIVERARISLHVLLGSLMDPGYMGSSC
jgi:hypothetical protein